MTDLKVLDEDHILLNGVAYHAEPTSRDGLCAPRCAFARDGACDFDYHQIGCMAHERQDGREIVWVQD